jgi:hypothetical protein
MLGTRLNGCAVGVAAVAMEVAREYLFEGRDMGPGFEPRMEISDDTVA